jgi:hypothetical protein
VKAKKICNAYNIPASLVNFDTLIEGSSRAKKFGKLAGNVYGAGLPLAFIIPRKLGQQELLAQQVKPGKLYYPVLIHVVNQKQAKLFTSAMFNIVQEELQSPNHRNESIAVSRKRDVFKNLLSPYRAYKDELNWFKLAKGDNYDIPLWTGNKDVLVLRTADLELAQQASQQSEQYITGLVSGHSLNDLIKNPGLVT